MQCFASAPEVMDIDAQFTAYYSIDFISFFMQWMSKWGGGHRYSSGVWYRLTLYRTDLCTPHHRRVTTPTFFGLCTKDLNAQFLSACSPIFSLSLYTHTDTHTRPHTDCISSFNPKLLKEGKGEKSFYNVEAQQCLVTICYLTLWLEAAVFLLSALYDTLSDRCRGCCQWGTSMSERCVKFKKKHPGIFQS